MKFGTVFRGRKQSNFNPSHAQVKDAIGRYFEAGGRITRIENLKSSYIDFMAGKNEVTADDFLMGE